MAADGYGFTVTKSATPPASTTSAPAKTECSQGGGLAGALETKACQLSK
jgi:hypothetical protein